MRITVTHDDGTARDITPEGTPWLGHGHRPETRPVQDSDPTPGQVAATVLQEMCDPGYMVSFYDGDVIQTNDALRILAEAVLPGGAS